MGQRLSYHQLWDIETLLANEAISRKDILSYVRDIGCIFSEDQSRSNYVAARRLMKVRKVREKLFGEQLFVRDPAWDMLLELYVAHADGRSLTVKSVCHASRAPLATAFRYLDLLEQQEIVSKERDRTNSRQVLVSLTTQGYTAVDSTLMEMQGDD